MLKRASFVASLVAGNRRWKLLPLSFLTVHICCPATVTPASHPSQPVQRLVAEVVYNELHDRACDSFWEYRSERIVGNQDLVREQVETAEGPVFRVLEDHGSPLSAAERRREDRRLQDLVDHPGVMAKVRQDHEQDEERMMKIIRIMPAAFLYDYDGKPDGDLVQIAFRPNPAFIPSSYEERLVHALAGALKVNQRMKRMVDLKGQVVDRVDFGYGLLGHVEKGGTFEIRRQQVSESHWKTNLVDVHVQGKLLLFKNVTRDQREARSDFRPVSQDIQLAAAMQLLDQAQSSSSQVSLSRDSDSMLPRVATKPVNPLPSK